MSKYLLAGAAAIIVVAGAAFFLLQSGGAAADQDLHYVPSDAQMIASVRVDELVKSQAYKDMIAELEKSDPKNADPNKEFEPKMGLSINDVVRVTVGANQKSEGLMVLTTNKAMTASDMKGKMKRGKFTFANGKVEETWEPAKFSEVKVGGFTVYEEQGGDELGFCVAGPNTVLYGKPADLKAVLERNKKAELSVGMKSALDLANQKKTFFVAFNGKGAPTKDLPLGPAAGMVDNVEAMAIDGSIAADAELNVVAACKEAKDAEEMKKSLEGFVAKGKVMASAMNLPADITKSLHDLKIDNKGNQVTAKTSIKLKPATLMFAFMASTQGKANFNNGEPGVIIPPPPKQ